MTDLLPGPTSAADRFGTVPPQNAAALDEALLAACDRLRQISDFLSMRDRHAKQNQDLSSHPQAQRARHQITSLQQREAERLRNDVRNVYRGTGTTYQDDLELLKSFLSSQAAIVGETAVEKRDALIDSIRQRYTAASEVSDLAQTLSVVLAARSQLPLALTAEQTRIAESLPSAEGIEPILYSEDHPNSRTETENLLSSIALEHVDFSPPKDSRDAAWRGLAVGIALGAKRRRFPSLERWGTWRDATDGPFPGRASAIEQKHGPLSLTAQRQQTYIRHPVILLIPRAVDPYQVADAVRLMDPVSRNAAIRSLVDDALGGLKTYNDEMSDLFEGTKPREIDWGEYLPLLKAAASYLVTGQDDPLEAALIRAYGELDRWSTADKVDVALAAMGVVLLFASFYISAPFGLLMLADAGLTALGIATAAEHVRDAATKRDRAQLDEAFAKLSDDLGMIESQSTPEWAKLALFVELLGAVPMGRLARLALKPAEGQAGRIRRLLQTQPAGPGTGARAAKESPVSGASSKTRLGAPDETTEDTARYGFPPQSRATPETKLTSQSSTPRDTAKAEPVGGDGSPRDEALATGHEGLESTQPEVAAPRSSANVEETEAGGDGLGSRDMHPDDIPLITSEAEPLDPRLEALRTRSRPYASFEDHIAFEKHVTGSFSRFADEAEIPVDEMDALYENYIEVVYGRQVADRGIYGLVQESPAGYQFAALQQQIIDDAVANGTRLDTRATRISPAKVTLPDGREVTNFVINIEAEVVDVGNVNGVPSIVHVVRFKRSELQTLGIANYEERFIARYAQANATIAEMVDWDGTPAVLLPKAIKDSDRKTASRAFRRHTPVGSGFKVNIDEALPRSLDGAAIDLNQRLESDLINAIYSKADKTLVDWARARSQDATIGVVGIRVEFAP